MMTLGDVLDYRSACSKVRAQSSTIFPTTEEVVKWNMTGIVDTPNPRGSIFGVAFVVTDPKEPFVDPSMA